MMRHCPHCTAVILLTCTRCPFCAMDTATAEPKQLPSGPVVLNATDAWVEDRMPDGKNYTTKLARQDVPAREVDYGHLARILGDMRIGEASYGIGVDVLAEQWPWVYSRSALQRGGGL